MVIQFRRWNRKTWAVGGSLAGILMGWTGAGPVLAQVPSTAQPIEQSAPSTAPVQRNYLNKTNVRLPIQITDAGRASLKEVQLYIKERRTSPWVLRDKVAPNQKAFTVHLPKDGEYQFTMVTVDNRGQRVPDDLRNEPAGLIVVIDTTAPVIELTNLGQTPDGQLIQFDAKDANLDNGRVRFAFQSGDRVFRPLEPVPGKSNLYCIPVQAVFTGLIRATAEDLAGNVTVFEEHVSKLRGMAPVANQMMPSSPSIAGNPPVRMETMPQMKEPNPLPSALTSSGQVAPLPVLENAGPKHVVERTNGEYRLTEHTQPTPQASAMPLKRQIVNNPKLYFDYQLENVGSSGVSKLEVWITRDQGKSWTKLSETGNQGKAVEVSLPGEGLFGVTLVACNGQGLAGAAPKNGDTADWWIEIDTTKPTVEISKIGVVPENGQNVVHIHWTAQDKNIGETPVDLFYSATAQGPWLPIAKGLKAEGQHRWTPPADIGTQTHVRLVARDVAGNTTIVNTLEPVMIGDQSRPRAVIRSVSTSAPVPVQIVPVEGTK